MGVDYKDDYLIFEKFGTIIALLQFMKKSGIYQIRNTLNNKVYIGGTLDLVERKGQHFRQLKENRHHSISLQNAYNKYGREAFVFEIIEKCYGDWKIIQERENYYLNKLGEAVNYINGVSKNFIKLTYNIKPFAQKGFFGKHSRETILKMRMNHPFRKEDILVYNLDGICIDEGLSIGEISLKYDINKSSISDCLKSKRYILKQRLIVGFKDDLDFQIWIFSQKFPIIDPKKRTTPYSWLQKINRGRKVIITNVETDEKYYLFTLQEAARMFDIDVSSVHRLLKSGKPYKGILKFEYYREDIV